METPPRFGKTAKAVGVAWFAANTLLKQGVNEMRTGFLNSPCGRGGRAGGQDSPEKACNLRKKVYHRGTPFSSERGLLARQGLWVKVKSECYWRTTTRLCERACAQSWTPLRKSKS